MTEEESTGKRSLIWQFRQIVSELVTKMHDEGKENLDIAASLRIDPALVDEIVEYYRETKTRRTVYLERSN
jgi:hypothetical protein